MATEKKDAAAGRVADYGEAIHESANRLEEKDPNIAWFTHRAADKIQAVAEYMRGTDMTSLRSDCERIARRHPAAFFGGLFVAGLLLGNVVKASRRKLDARSGMSDGSERDYAPMGESDSFSPDLRAAEREAAGLTTPQI